MFNFSDSTIQIINKDTKSILNLNGHKSPILSVKLDPLSKFLVINIKDFIINYKLLYIFNLLRFHRVVMEQ